MNKEWWIGGISAGLLAVGTLTTGVVAAAADSTAVVANGASPGPLRLLVSGQIGRLLALRSELDLTSDQKQQIRQVLQSNKAQIADVLRPLVAKRRALRDAVMAGTPDEKAIRAAAADMAGAIGDAAVVASKIRGQIAPLLTLEQRQKVEEFRKNSQQGVDHFLDTLGQAG